MKFFDKNQIVLTIGAGVSINIYTCLIFSYYFLYYLLEDEQRLAYQTVTSLFLYLEIFFLTWFFARAVTFKMREKEVEEEQKEY